MSSRRSQLVFAVAAFAYLVAVAQRSSLGAAGIIATERFETSATQLAALGVMQVIVYASLQIPVGMLLDRFGPSRLILTGAALMVVGQATVALSPDLSWAIVGRMLVGAGDATTYVSGLRLIGSWFTAPRVPIMTQWYSATGQTGQILSVLPFAALLGATGWAPAFLSIAGLAVVSLVLGVAVLRDSAGTRFAGTPVSAANALRSVNEAFRHPGTRLGFWTHLTTQFSMVSFSLLWGYPMMVNGLGYSPALGSLLLSLIVVFGLAIGPVIGVLTARFPFRRSNLVLGISGLTLATWVTFLVWPGVPPLWFVIVVIAVLGAGGVGSTIGFDFARTSNPAARFGAASGVVNVGGFLASLTTMFVIGVVLDLVGPGAGGVPTLGDYRAAYAVYPVILVAGMTAIIIVRHKARRRLEHDEGIIVGRLWVAVARRWRQRRNLGE
ncbi:MFS transporter [Pseudoclavibacter endophyticus]|uniref:MFS transporter n=1 Tax=Pseudoclavibacter endophyticus TaxID=1778590 RepID=A0A6H9WQP8_9MICO|nr:MFS transporter [Pseudoclavibacter endophyticus]KAB1650021.1 MFS transporter [Pseudoclavibacter endophyticus]GGA57896.1 MFS transporter [Pseudoclavibacter endophyticus]